MLVACFQSVELAEITRKLGIKMKLDQAAVRLEVFTAWEGEVSCVQYCSRIFAGAEKWHRVENTLQATSYFPFPGSLCLSSQFSFVWEQWQRALQAGFLFQVWISNSQCKKHGLTCLLFGRICDIKLLSVVDSAWGVSLIWVAAFASALT